MNRPVVSPPSEQSAVAELRLDRTASFPYPPSVYMARALWKTVFLTLWKLCPRRLYFLRAGILKLFGADVAWTVGLSHSVWIEMPWELSVGEHTTFGPGVVIYNLGGASIGKHTVISQDVYLCGGTHDYLDPLHPLVRKRIRIGDQVWICAGAFISPGVTVGHGAVVGARAVVVKDVLPWTVVAGNPARPIARRVLRTRSSDPMSRR